MHTNNNISSLVLTHGSRSHAFPTARLEVRWPTTKFVLPLREGFEPSPITRFFLIQADWPPHPRPRWVNNTSFLLLRLLLPHPFCSTAGPTPLVGSFLQSLAAWQTPILPPPSFHQGPLDIPASNPPPPLQCCHSSASPPMLGLVMSSFSAHPFWVSFWHPFSFLPFFPADLLDFFQSIFLPPTGSEPPICGFGLFTCSHYNLRRLSDRGYWC